LSFKKAQNDIKFTALVQDLSVVVISTAHTLPCQSESSWRFVLASEDNDQSLLQPTDYAALFTATYINTGGLITINQSINQSFIA